MNNEPLQFWEIAGIFAGLLVVVRAILYYIEYK